MKSADLLDDIKRAYGLASDYALGQFMGWGHAKISNYRHGRSRFDEDTCEQIAEKLHMDPVAVHALVNAERTTSKSARATWLRLYAETKKKAAKMAAGTTLSLFMLAGQINGLTHSPALAGLHSVYYGKRRKLLALMHARRAERAGQRDLFMSVSRLFSHRIAA